MEIIKTLRLKNLWTLISGGATKILPIRKNLSHNRAHAFRSVSSDQEIVYYFAMAYAKAHKNPKDLHE